MIGSVIGSFKILDKLGEGGMGTVYLGIDLMLDRRVALKMLRPDLARDAQIVERFRSEAVTLARISHPRVATLYSFFRDHDQLFMVMEYVPGKTLDRVLSEDGAMPPDRAVPVFCQALDGIDHAHRLGIIHRDLKPGNLMLLADGTIKVMDFGIARVLGTSRLTRTGRLVGTVEYMSPEQVRGREAGVSSDIYSLGIVLFEMLTGRVPFHAESEYELMRAQLEDAPPPPRTFAPGIPPALEAAVLRALAKDPAARFPTASDFRAALLSQAFTAPAEARVIPGAPALKATRLADAQPARPASSQRRLSRAAGILWSNSKYYAGAAALLAIAAIVALVLVGSPQNKPAAESKPLQAPQEEQRPTQHPTTTPAPARPATAAAPVRMNEPPDVHASAEQDIADRERERRRAAAARRRAAEKALDLR